MKCSQLLFSTVLLGVVILVYLSTSAYCENSSEQSTVRNETYEIKPGRTLKMGRRQPNDMLVFNGTVKKENPDRAQKVSTEFQWPAVMDDEATIYKISKIELKDKGNGSLIHVFFGGVQNIIVQLHLESQIGKGIEHQINIYANPFEDHEKFYRQTIESLSAKF